MDLTNLIIISAYVAALTAAFGVLGWLFDRASARFEAPKPKHYVGQVYEQWGRSPKV